MYGMPAPQHWKRLSFQTFLFTCLCTNGGSLVYYGKPLHRETLVNAPTGQLPESGQGELSATRVRLSTDNKMRSICNVDEQGEEKRKETGK